MSRAYVGAGEKEEKGGGWRGWREKDGRRARRYKEYPRDKNKIRLTYLNRRDGRTERGGASTGSGRRRRGEKICEIGEKGGPLYERSLAGAPQAGSTEAVAEYCYIARPL